MNEKQIDDSKRVVFTICIRCGDRVSDDAYNVCPECANVLYRINLRLDQELVDIKSTLRDQFAMAALSWTIGEQFSDEAAKMAYAIADAMLAEREKGVKG